MKFSRTAGIAGDMSRICWVVVRIAGYICNGCCCALLCLRLQWVSAVGLHAAVAWCGSRAEAGTCSALHAGAVSCTVAETECSAACMLISMYAGGWWMWDWCMHVLLSHPTRQVGPTAVACQMCSSKAWATKNTIRDAEFHQLSASSNLFNPSSTAGHS
jgi:hypothetical protein